VSSSKQPTAPLLEFLFDRLQSLGPLRGRRQLDAKFVALGGQRLLLHLGIAQILQGLIECLATRQLGGLSRSQTLAEVLQVEPGLLQLHL